MQQRFNIALQCAISLYGKPREGFHECYQINKNNFKLDVLYFKLKLFITYNNTSFGNENGKHLLPQFVSTIQYNTMLFVYRMYTKSFFNFISKRLYIKTHGPNCKL